MSDGGGGESLNESNSGSRKQRRKNDDFSQAIARIAVTQVCESLGFQGIDPSALDTFSDVVCKYIHEIGKTSGFYANLAGRSECNVFDVVQGLEDLSVSQGFVGASDGDHCLSESGIVKELSRFVSLSEEIGFAYSVPSFPVVKKRKLTPSFLQSGETPLSDVIPPWLPKFPDPETYTSMPVPNTEVAQTTTDKVEQKEVVEPTSSKPPQHLARNESSFLVVAEQGDIGGLRGTNPFLAVPLQPGEKDVSLVSLPAKFKEENMLRNHNNHIFELDASVPENQVVKNGGCDIEGGVRRVVTNNRPTARMKFCIDKKSLDTKIRRNDKGKEKVAFWFSNDEVRDDEEKRTEKHPSVPMNIEEHTANDSVVN
ncbi:transcription initiation factor TFIID subunit 8-like protein [Tanacetum coccineum]